MQRETNTLPLLNDDLQILSADESSLPYQERRATELRQPRPNLDLSLTDNDDNPVGMPVKDGLHHIPAVVHFAAN